MSGMLDRIALEVAKGLQDSPVDASFAMDDVNGWTQDKAYEIARAALMAMREIDPDTMLSVQWGRVPEEIQSMHRKVIDAILAEGGAE